MSHEVFSDWLTMKDSFKGIRISCLGSTPLRAEATVALDRPHPAGRLSRRRARGQTGSAIVECGASYSPAAGPPIRAHRFLVTPFCAKRASRRRAGGSPVRGHPTERRRRTGCRKQGGRAGQRQRITDRSDGDYDSVSRSNHAGSGRRSREQRPWKHLHSFSNEFPMETDGAHLAKLRTVQSFRIFIRHDGGSSQWDLTR